jgi:hypothetical protein
MLLELLNHHEDLFLAAVGPLIGARKTADLARLAASCRRLRMFIGTTLFYKHYVCFQHSLKNIKSMNILSNEYCSIKEYNNDLHVFRYEPIPIGATYPNIYNNRYCIRTIKTRILYSIIHDRERTMIKRDLSIISSFSMFVRGSLPSWINKYPVNITDKSIYYYTFTID